MQRSGRITMAAVVVTAILMTGCGTRAYRFGNAEPVARLDDSQPVPVPQRTEYRKFGYIFDSLVRRPAVNALKLAPRTRAKDVNAMDDVPASSWYTPRLGNGELLPEELLKGPADIGPPKLPVTVVKAKTGGANPGFIIADARGKRYLVKFDPPELPAVETTTTLIVNRLFWGFGYNVPEDYLFYFRADEMRVSPTGELTQADVDEVLAAVAPPVGGAYRATARLLIEGIILGPTPDKGVRKDDANDLIPHEDRRILRGLRVFSAFTNHSDIRIDNTLDVYAGEAGRGHVVHYLLDFGEAFGGHGAEHDYRWDGFTHYFEWGQTFENLATLGPLVEDWESIAYTPWRSVGMFESTVFRPKEWKEVYPFEPIRRSQPEDDYWAAKIIGALTGDHIRALVEAANYPDSAASEYMILTLIERRRKVLAYFMDQVTSVEPLELSAGQLRLRDVGKDLTGDSRGPSRYEIRFYDGDCHVVAPETTVRTEEAEFSIPVPPSGTDKGIAYLRVDVRDDEKPRAAQFHIRYGDESVPRLVGVVH